MDYSAFDALANHEAPEIEELPDVKEVLSGAAREALMLKVAAALNTFITDYLPKLSKDEIIRLRDALPPWAFMKSADVQQYGADFSMEKEIGLQISAVQALREHVFPNGIMRHDANVREAKDVLATCNQMVKTMMDSHEKIQNMERMRAVETATVDAMLELSEEQRKRFLELLEIRLARIK